jgi:urocanate hydratase
MAPVAHDPVSSDHDVAHEAAGRLERVLDCDTGLGVLRLADAGYETALQAKKRHGLGL